MGVEVEGEKKQAWRKFQVEYFSSKKKTRSWIKLLSILPVGTHPHSTLTTCCPLLFILALPWAAGLLWVMSEKLLYVLHDHWEYGSFNHTREILLSVLFQKSCVSTDDWYVLAYECWELSSWFSFSVSCKETQQPNLGSTFSRVCWALWHNLKHQSYFFFVGFLQLLLFLSTRSLCSNIFCLKKKNCAVGYLDGSVG